MTNRMHIEQGDNGWILRFIGHNCLDTVIIHETWGGVLQTLDDYFGYWVGDKWLKEK